MKTKLITLLALISFTSIFFTSCDKDEEGNIIVGKMSAKIGNEIWKPTLSPIGTSYNKYVIFGANSGGKKIRLVMNVGEKIELKKYDIKFKLFTAEGNIVIPKGLNIGRFTDVKDPKKPDAKLKYYSTLGEVIITEFNEQDNRISGTFKFTAKNSTKDEVEITEGKFSNVKLFSKAPFGDLVED